MEERDKLVEKFLVIEGDLKSLREIVNQSGFISDEDMLNWVKKYEELKLGLENLYVEVVDYLRG